MILCCDPLTEHYRVDKYSHKIKIYIEHYVNIVNLPRKYSIHTDRLSL